MFTPDCPGSSLLRAGDRVRFRPIGLEEFTRRSAAPESGT
jgi:allophanate hydrolase subunit 1